MVPNGSIPASAFTDAVRETAASLAAQPIGARDLAGELSRTLQGLIGLFDVLALAAVVIAALGIVNTLGMGVHERVREIAILRSHGMTVGQVQAMVVAEAAMMGTIAGILPLFRWSRIESATKYEVEIFNATGQRIQGPYTVDQPASGNPSYQLANTVQTTYALLFGATYKWRVTAKRPLPGTDDVAISDFDTFTVQAAAQPSVPTQTAPAPTTTASGPSPTGT